MDTGWIKGNREDRADYRGPIRGKSQPISAKARETVRYRGRGSSRGPVCGSLDLLGAWLITRQVGHPRPISIRVWNPCGISYLVRATIPPTRPLSLTNCIQIARNLRGNEKSSRRAREKTFTQEMVGMRSFIILLYRRVNIWRDSFLAAIEMNFRLTDFFLTVFNIVYYFKTEQYGSEKNTVGSF